MTCTGMRKSRVRNTIRRTRSPRMDHVCVSVGERSLEEGGPPRTYSSGSDTSRVRLGPTPMLWNYMWDEEQPFEKTIGKGEIWGTSALKDSEEVNILSMLWTDSM